VRDLVFISYSHKDRVWLTKLRTHLKPYERSEAFERITVWDDTRIRAGSKWRDEIEENLASASVAVLLVSPNFLESDFIHEHEIPAILHRAEQDGLAIVWIPVSTSAYDTTWIADYQAVHDPSKPLDSLRTPARNEALVSIAKEIQRLATGARPAPNPSTLPGVALAGPGSWHQALSDGFVEIEVVPASDDWLTFIRVVEAVLLEKRFQRHTADRSASILVELLNNVAQHASEASARISITLQDDFLRSVRIVVSDDGPGFDPGTVIEGHYDALLAGEREHGLFRVLRFASIADVVPDDDLRGMTHGIVCELFDPDPPRSVLFEYDFVAAVRMEYVFPRVFWIGRDDVYFGPPFPGRPHEHGRFEHALAEAVEKDWMPVLELYFGALASSHPRYLGIEVSGGKPATEVGPGAFGHLSAALELFFATLFQERRVLVLAHDTDGTISSSVAQWATRRGAEYFSSEASCRTRLRALASLP
jgi:anti-sigma regulatory factor (Ser/Thr protein kinase)